MFLFFQENLHICILYEGKSNLVDIKYMKDRDAMWRENINQFTLTGR